MQLETKFLRLRTPVTPGSRFGDWKVCWLGGWTRDRLSYIVMVVRPCPELLRGDIAADRPQKRTQCEVGFIEPRKIQGGTAGNHKCPSPAITSAVLGPTERCCGRVALHRGGH